MIPVKMRAVQPMTYNGKKHEVGAMFEIAEERLEDAAQHFEKQGLAIRIDNQLAKEIEKEKRNLNTITARELMKRRKDNSYIIQDFLLPKTVNMLYSPPGEYKSLLTLDACISIAVGAPWMDLKTRKGRVLILDRENSESELRNRLVALVSGHKWQRKRSLIDLNLIIRDGTLDDPSFVEHLEEYVKENNISLIVFDTVRRFGNFEENSSDDMNRLYTSFLQIINGSKASILFLHHSRKEGGTYRGSVDILGQVDSAYKLEKRKNPFEFRLVCEKSRSGEISEINGVIDWDKENERTTIKRVDVHDVEEKPDKYAKFRKARIWFLNAIENMCPMAGNTFVRARAMESLEAYNVDVLEKERISTRMADRILAYLVSTKYLVKTGGKGEFRRLFVKEGYGFVPQKEENGD